MRVDVFDQVSPSRVVVLQREAQTLAAIVDGAGSWGSGRQAADWTRGELARGWTSARNWTAASLAADISTVAASTPDSLRDPEFGWSFSVTCVLMTQSLVECVAAGFYRVDVCGPCGVVPLFRPEMLVDQLLANRTLTPQTAEVFPHSHICLGLFVGDRNEVVLTSLRHAIVPDEVVVVTHAARYDLANLRIPESAQALAAISRPGAYPSPVIMAWP